MGDLYEYFNSSPLVHQIIEYVDKYAFDYIQADLEKAALTFLVILGSWVVFRMGKSRGRGDVLISKKLKERIHSAETKRDFYLNLQKRYESRSKSLSQAVKVYYVFLILLAILGGVFYQNVLEYVDQLFIEIVSAALLLILVTSRIARILLNRKSNSIQTMLKTYQQEKEELGQTIAMQLGPELTKVLKDQIFGQERLQLEELKKQELHRIKAELDRRYNEKFIEQQTRIKELEQREQSLIQQSRRNTAPIISERQNVTERSRLDQMLVKGLKDQRNLMQNFITGVVQFDWGDECLKLLDGEGVEVDSAQVRTKLSEFMVFSGKLGSKFNQDMEQWKQQNAEYKALKRVSKTKKN